MKPYYNHTACFVVFSLITSLQEFILEMSGHRQKPQPTYKLTEGIMIYQLSGQETRNLYFAKG